MVVTRLGLLALLQACALATSNVQFARRATTPGECAGYNASNVRKSLHGLTADLVLIQPCAVYGEDIANLTLTVEYEDASRMRVKIADAAGQRYEVPDSVFPRPRSKKYLPLLSELDFKYTTTPFSFQVIRKSNHEVLFDTTGQALVFEQQYLRLQTLLPPNANIYGLGEHTHTFRLPTTNLTRTMWNRDAYGVEEGKNLYGDHPVYFEHRTTGTHGVLLVNSNGLEIKINQVGGNTALEYNAIGGIIELYFLSGSTEDPTEVARQYADIVGRPAEVPYWSFGFHQCRNGYLNYVETAQAIANYSKAGIPMETLWNDIDYMKDRWIFTNDEKYYPLDRIREIVSFLHAHNQHYIVMVDPAVASQPNVGYGTYDRGVEDGIFVRSGETGDFFVGVVWPGAAVYPDWFHPKTQAWWTNEFKNFFDPKTGIDVDGIWIDMNEAASFCPYPCNDPVAYAKANNYPPARTTPAPPPDAPIFTDVQRRSALPDPVVFDTSAIVENAAPMIETRAPPINASLDYQKPPYKIKNAFGELSSRTIYTTAVHANGLIEYDTHNLYGEMMSTATQKALEARRPGLRTFVITRSTFPGAGAKVGKWLGDNLSNWWHYRKSIPGILQFNSIFQVPMVGPDTCGYGNTANERLCARWAALGAFYPFFRNHNQAGRAPQEFYRWPLVTEAAKKALDTRYRLLDYFYTAFHRQSVDGTPSLSPLWYKYPTDQNTWGIDMQFFFGDSILVSPVTDENATSVSIYLPKDTFYDFYTHERIDGQGTTVTLTNISFTDVPTYIRAGSVLPVRAKGAMTTTELRKNDFSLIIAPDSRGIASGKLYVDDGVSLKQKGTTEVEFTYFRGLLTVWGKFSYKLDVNIGTVTVLGQTTQPKIKIDNKVSSAEAKVSSNGQSVDVKLGMPFTRGFTLALA